MSVENTEKVNSENSDEAKGNVDLMAVVKDLEGKVSSFEKTNARLLEESHRYKTKYNESKEALQELDAIKESKLSSEEKVKLQEEKLQSLQSEYAGTKDRIFGANVRATLSNRAKDAHNVDALLGMKEYAHLLEKDEDTLDLTPESADRFVETLREKEGYLFSTGKVAPMGSGNKIDNGIGHPKSAKTMSSQERIAAAVELSKLSKGK